jgi:DUF4097 and DUF4098 domain-containing protein YvlB
MASPTTNAPPPTPPVMYRRRSFAGPVILIVLGVIFLLGNLGYMAWGRLGYLFARYWPLLIILWGLIKLAEHFDAQRQGYRPRGIGFGGVMFLIFLVMLGLGASSAWRYRGALNDEFFQIDDQPGFTIFGTPYNYTDELQQAFPSGASLRVVSDRGEVRLVPWDENNIKVSVQKKVIADSQSAADKVNAATKPTITVAGDLVTVNANTSSASGNHRVDTNLEIYVPRRAAADIATARGKVEVHDRTGDLKISNSHGDVEVGGIQGNVSISLRGGSVRADNVTGDLSLNGRVNDVTVEDLQGSVRLTGDFFGTTRLSKIANAVHFQSSRTDLEMARLDGELVLESGDLRANSLAGPTRVITRAKDIRLDDFTGNVRIEDNNSDIELTPGKLPLGNIQITNHRGRIQLVLPANAAFHLDAHASRGEISSDFPGLNVQSRAHDSQATGSVGSGGPQIQLSTERGDIEIRKG